MVHKILSYCRQMATHQGLVAVVVVLAVGAVVDSGAELYCWLVISLEVVFARI